MYDARDLLLLKRKKLITITRSLTMAPFLSNMRHDYAKNQFRGSNIVNVINKLIRGHLVTATGAHLNSS
jgi:hypothetical protein